MSINQKLQKFCQRYQINVLSTNKRCVKYIKPMTHFLDPTDLNTALPSTHYETEPVATIDIPLSSLEKIAEVESTFYNNIEDVERRRYFENWMHRQSEEKYLQEKYPSVKQAYEQYSLMLHMCKEFPK